MAECQIDPTVLHLIGLGFFYLTLFFERQNNAQSREFYRTKAFKAQYPKLPQCNIVAPN